MGSLPNDTVIMVSFRPSANTTAPPAQAPHQAQLSADASNENLVTSHGRLQVMHASASGNSITLADPAQTLVDTSVVDPADDLLLLKRAATPPGQSSLYWAFLYPPDTPHPPYSVNPPNPQPGQTYAITSNDGGRIKIVTTWPLVHAAAAGASIPPFPG